MKQPTKTIIEQAIEPIIWTGTKEQLAAAIDVFVQNGCIANENHWKIFSDHFEVINKATNEPERVEPTQLSSIFNKTPSSRAKVKKLTDELSEGLKP
jgi:polyhydroxyalkanoate synthesis regulator phasin